MPFAPLRRVRLWCERVHFIVRWPRTSSPRSPRCPIGCSRRREYQEQRLGSPRVSGAGNQGRDGTKKTSEPSSRARFYVAAGYSRSRAVPQQPGRFAPRLPSPAEHSPFHRAARLARPGGSGGDALCVTVFTYSVLNLCGFNELQELLTAPLAGAFFLGVCGGVPDVSQKPNEIKAGSSHNSPLSDVKGRVSRHQQPGLQQSWGHGALLSSRRRRLCFAVATRFSLPASWAKASAC